MNSDVRQDLLVLYRAKSAGRLGMMVTVLLFAVLSSPTRAEEFCIACQEPWALYACSLKENLGQRLPDAAKLHCIKELARTGGHRTCRVSRRDQGNVCAGDRVVLAAPTVPPRLIAAPPPGAPVAPQENDNTAGRPPIDASDNQQEMTGGAHETAGLPLREADEPSAQPDKAAKTDEPPKTVEELAKRAAKDSQESLEKAGEFVSDTAQSTGETIKDAGNAVGGAAKKTWDCVVSLFSDC